MTFVKNIPTQDEILIWLNNVKMFDGLTTDALIPILENASYMDFSIGELIS